jgi:hypothetical protein
VALQQLCKRSFRTNSGTPEFDTLVNCPVGCLGIFTNAEIIQAIAASSARPAEIQLKPILFMFVFYMAHVCRARASAHQSFPQGPPFGTASIAVHFLCKPRIKKFAELALGDRIIIELRIFAGALDRAGQNCNVYAEFLKETGIRRGAISALGA